MATRKIILLRHGQYHKKTENSSERLTKLGIKQAKFAGIRLKEYKINSIVHSTMSRAVETATVVKNLIKFKGKMKADDSLCECVPGFPIKLRKKYKYTDVKKLNKHKAQADIAFKKYFKNSRTNRTDLLVCHGNIIRYLICKLLNTDTLSWVNLDIQQCGICIVELRTKGSHRRVLISHNDIGHIPLKMRTFI